MRIDIRIAETRKQLKSFIRFPLDLYRGSAQYVPNLNADEYRTLSPVKNPAFDFCRAKYWTAHSNGKIVGRIAGIINDRYEERWSKPYARFGWVDFIDDDEVSAALFGACEDWARGEGKTSLHGPLGFTDLDPEGLLIDGFDELGMLPTIYNHSYYPDHITRLGFRKDVDWLEYSVRIPDELPEKIHRVAEMVQRRANLKPVFFKRRRHALKYAREIFEVLNKSYAPLYAVTELSDQQIDAYIKQYFGFIHKDLVPIIVDESDHVIAFAIAMPQLSFALQKAWGRLFPTGGLHLLHALRTPRAAELYLLAVRPDYQGRGVNALVMSTMHQACRKLGIKTAEASPQLETNRTIQAFWRYFDFRQHKRRRVYIKDL